jgi:hypothetical protein
MELRRERNENNEGMRIIRGKKKANKLIGSPPNSEK